MCRRGGRGGQPDGTARLRIHMIDSVGYMIPGAMGAEEGRASWMVTTPWFDRENPHDPGGGAGDEIMEGATPP